jgi:DNA-binding MarR family transcriptional regulator
VTGGPTDEIASSEQLRRAAETVREANRALEVLLPILGRLAESEGLRELARGERPQVAGGAVRAAIAARRLRDEHFGPELRDAGWALLLEAYAARLDGRRLAMTELGAEAELAPTTAHRWIAWLVRRGLLVRCPHPQDERIVLVVLADATVDRVRGYLAAALRLSPLVA